MELFQWKFKNALAVSKTIWEEYKCHVRIKVNGDIVINHHICLKSCIMLVDIYEHLFIKKLWWVDVGIGI